MRIAGRLLLLLLVARTLTAQDHPHVIQHPRAHRTSHMPRHPVRTTAFHFGDSPFAPLDNDDTVYVVDNDFDLDTGCTFHSSSPLVVHLPMYRYVGPVRADGTLQDATGLI